MNRIVVFGVAIFFALVGIALMGGESKASAFILGGGCGCSGGGCHHRCHGRCHGGGHARCHGGCHARCHGRCHGRCNGGCNGGGCCGGYAGGGKEATQAPMGPEKQAPMQAP